MPAKNGTKRRVSKACDTCRKSKTKCDGERPCQRCLLENKICAYSKSNLSYSQGKLKKLYNQEYVDLLETRVSLLKKVLNYLFLDFNKILQSHVVDIHPENIIQFQKLQYDSIILLGKKYNSEKIKCNPKNQQNHTQSTTEDDEEDINDQIENTADHSLKSTITNDENHTFENPNIGNFAISQQLQSTSSQLNHILNNGGNPNDILKLPGFTKSAEVWCSLLKNKDYFINPITGNLNINQVVYSIIPTNVEMAVKSVNYTANENREQLLHHSNSMDDGDNDDDDDDEDNNTENHKFFEDGYVNKDNLFSIKHRPITEEPPPSNKTRKRRRRRKLNKEDHSDVVTASATGNDSNTANRNDRSISSSSTTTSLHSLTDSAATTSTNNSSHYIHVNNTNGSSNNTANAIANNNDDWYHHQQQQLQDAQSAYQNYNTAINTRNANSVNNKFFSTTASSNDLLNHHVQLGNMQQQQQLGNVNTSNINQTFYQTLIKTEPQPFFASTAGHLATNNVLLNSNSSNNTSTNNNMSNSNSNGNNNNSSSNSANNVSVVGLAGLGTSVSHIDDATQHFNVTNHLSVINNNNNNNSIVVNGMVNDHASSTNGGTLNMRNNIIVNNSGIPTNNNSSGGLLNNTNTTNIIEGSINDGNNNNAHISNGDLASDNHNKIHIGIQSPIQKNHHFIKPE
ncbi:uncharacterized protein SCODWIG_01534 [Saccharomycodes ludwigii]|uniref:Zn(2)-C6 fungal-type domain-containing protein n=1 Tax=Saccharomycodes ludwigii TaxID=36035 RepID=A0A376B540_9ASCO|nr:hypothetical protein SCDLUD_000603 [Saccharomycodes ludwigii]KAH3903000.1 hypothetical protein SCDLUD_000603 [Saccharomycodes ludwigii]SSD59773.1 uncharacterized protein SCODWIG_01534 [Saccharomycodes ludwigii]